MTDELHTLGRWTTDRALATGDRIAVDDRGVVLTYRDLDDRASRLAQRLREQRLPHRRPDRHDHRQQRRPGGAVLRLREGRTRAGTAVLATVAARTRLADRTGGSGSAAGRGGVRHASPRRRARGSYRRHRSPPSAAAASRPAVPARGGLGEAAGRQEVRDDDALLIIFTSGTQGQPKGAILTHSNCFWTNLALSRIAEITSSDTVLAVMPQYHVGGWNVQPLLAWWVGATVVLERTFDPGRVLQLIKERHITTTMGVPANYLFLAQHPAVRRRRPVQPAPRHRRRRTDAGAAAAHLARQGSRAHPGLRPHRGLPERAVPSRRRRPQQGGTGRQTVPSRRGRRRRRGDRRTAGRPGHRRASRARP